MRVEHAPAESPRRGRLADGAATWAARIASRPASGSGPQPPGPDGGGQLAPLAAKSKATGLGRDAGVGADASCDRWGTAWRRARSTLGWPPPSRGRRQSLHVEAGQVERGDNGRNLQLQLLEGHADDATTAWAGGVRPLQVLGSKELIGLCIDRPPSHSRTCPVTHSIW